MIELGGRLDIGARWQDAVDQTMGEVRLELYALRNEPQTPAQGGSVHFHGPVGAYQTGAGATANLSLDFSSHALGELNAILQQTSADLAAAGLPDEVQDVAARALSESATEAAKTKPDVAKLISALNATVSLLERLPALRTAYYTVKGWLASHIPGMP